MNNSHNMNFDGIKWLYAQSIPLMTTWYASANMDGVIRTSTMIVALIAGILFAVKMYHEMRKSRREDLEHKNR